jgi:hypothetical protein
MVDVGFLEKEACTASASEARLEFNDGPFTNYVTRTNIFFEPLIIYAKPTKREMQLTGSHITCSVIPKANDD